MSIDPVVQGLDLSLQFLNAISAYIKSQIENTFLDKIPGVDIIARTIDHELAQSEQAIITAEKAIKTQIEPLITNAIPDAIAVVTAIAKSLDHNLSQLVNNIATTEDVLGSAITTIKHHAPELAKWLYTEVSGGLGATLLNVLKEMEIQDGAGVNAMLDHVLALPHQPAWFTELTKGFRHRGAEWQALALPAILVGAIIGIVEAIQEPFQVATRQGSFNVTPTRVTPPESLIDLLNKQAIDPAVAIANLRQSGFDHDPVRWMQESTRERLTPMDAANMAFRGIINRDQAIQEMRLHGLSDDYALNTLALAQRLIPEDGLRMAFLRGLIDGKMHDTKLEMMGYDPYTAGLLRQLYFYIPPVPDIIHMGIRNVFNPEIVQRFNLLGDYPKAFEDAAAQQGVSKEWAEKYWEAHWIVPGRSEAFEMFQRTTDKPLDDHADKITLSDGSTVYNIIGKDTLNLLLREVDTPPFYRDKVTQVAYRPLTRIDIRRLNKVGLLNHAGVERAYLDLGYTHAHALMLADFTEKLNATATKDQASTLVTGLQRKVVELYVADKLPLEQVQSTLMDLGFTDAEITVFVTEATLVHESEFITASETGIGKLYMAGLITDKDAINRMQSIGTPIDAQTTLFAKWDLAIEYRGGSDHIHKHRELTKGEVLEAFADGLMDEPTTESMLEDMGYDKNSADAEIGLSIYKASRSSKRTQIDSIKASFVNGVIEQLDASNRLDALYVPSDQRDAYLTEWTLARETRTERIPIATLRDMLKGQYIDEPTTLSHLRRHRFTDDDALLLVRFWQAQKAPKGLVGVSSS
jgi:hypothetical protein